MHDKHAYQEYWLYAYLYAVYTLYWCALMHVVATIKKMVTE